jgi:hypothetical protein
VTLHVRAILLKRADDLLSLSQRVAGRLITDSLSLDAEFRQQGIAERLRRDARLYGEQLLKKRPMRLQL